MSVVGVVVEQESGRPLSGLRVRAYDQDLVFDDALGETRTDAAGRFEIVFTEAQFRDFTETAPDLYIRIYDATGTKLLHTTERAVRHNAGVREHFDVRIAQSALA
jgi:hypothetical protein